MTRMHIHIGVDELDAGIRFYSALFGVAPVKTKTDYAKWILDETRVNFAISTRAGRKGVDHLGLQAEDEGELDEIRTRLKRADLATFDEGETVCCYARSDKTWVADPSGVAWEAYHTMGDAQVFSDTPPADDETCCTPETRGRPGCCEPIEGGECCS